MSHVCVRRRRERTSYHEAGDVYPLFAVNGSAVGAIDDCTWRCARKRHSVCSVHAEGTAAAHARDTAFVHAGRAAAAIPANTLHEETHNVGVQNIAHVETFCKLTKAEEGNGFM